MSLLLNGVRPEPLASYLTGLGILRILHEQVDDQVCGHWSDRGFVLETNLNHKALVDFFCEKWVPSPICSPWNGGSGFYEGDNVEGRDVILNATNPRLKPYAEVIRQISSWEELPTMEVPPITWLERGKSAIIKLHGKQRDDLQKKVNECAAAIEKCEGIELDQGDLDLLLAHAKTLPTARRKRVEAIQKALKDLRTALNDRIRKDKKIDFMKRARNELPEAFVRWLDAAVGVRDGDFAALPLLGSGGNEGRLDYSNQYMKLTAHLLCSDVQDDALRHLLFGQGTPKLQEYKVGQFAPGETGGFNQGYGVKTKSMNNPWRFVLTMEGALVWTGSVARRNNTSTRKMVMSPFTVGISANGFGSAAEIDGEKARAELWMPLWKRPTGMPELQAFLSEGRAEVQTGTGNSARARPARNGLDFARAASTLGVSRGVEAFTRYALLLRRGKSYVALPAGRFEVRKRDAATLLRELDQPLAKIDGFLRQFPGKSGSPPRFARARRRIDDAIYLVAERGDPTDVTRLLRAIGNLERLFIHHGSHSTPHLNQPVTGLSFQWLKYADNRVELRLARSYRSLYSKSNAGPLRANMAHIDPTKPWSWANGSGPEWAWRGSNVFERLASVLQRRSLHRSHDPEALEDAPLRGWRTASLGDALTLLRGEVDGNALEELLFALNWMGSTSTAPRSNVSHTPKSTERSTRDTARPPHAIADCSKVDRGLVPPSFAVLALLYADTPLREEIVRAEPRILPLILAGRTPDACSIALHRLRVTGLIPRISTLHGDGLDPAHLAAALLLPLSEGTLRSLMRQVLQQPTNDQTNEETDD